MIVRRNFRRGEPVVPSYIHNGVGFVVLRKARIDNSGQAHCWYERPKK